MLFYVGLHQPAQARHFARAFVSINRVRGRKRPVPSPAWILDAGAFTELLAHGRYRHEPGEYAASIGALAARNPGLVAAVTQDFMCEPFILERTGLSIAEHQRLTITRYDALRASVKRVYVMPVLQGYAPASYVEHLRAYGERLAAGAYVGVGSLCKRNGDPRQVAAVLAAIKADRPDLRLHGFGLKLSALGLATVRDALESADSMAWSWAARRQGGDANDWQKAARFVRRIETMPVQLDLFTLA